MFATFREYLLGKWKSVDAAGLSFCVSPRDPFFFVNVGPGHTGVAITAHVDDILGCGERGVARKVKAYFTRHIGSLGTQETNFNHGDMEIAQQEGYSVTVSRKVFTVGLQLLPMSAELWRQR